MKNIFKHFFKNLFVLITILFLCDILFGTILQWILLNSPDGRYYKAKYSLEQCNEDILVIGSSRAETNYVSTIIEKELNMTCWNMGRGGQGIPFFRCMEGGVLKRYAPKMVIINTEANILEKKMSYEKAGFLKPFYYRHKEIRPILNEISFFERVFMLSRLYAFNSSYYYLIRPYFFKGIDGKKEDKGWKPRIGIISEKSELEKQLISVNENESLNTEAVKEFEKLIDLFMKRGSKIVIVTPPNYKISYVFTSTIQYLKKLSEEKDILYLNYGNCMPIMSKAYLYKDPNHLNVEGAKQFTKMLTSELQKKLN